MKICHIVDELGIGGLEKTIIEITSGLKGHAQEIWCLKKKGRLARDAEASGTVVREFGFEGSMTHGAMSKLTGELARAKFDVVHSHGLYPYIWGVTAALFAGTRGRFYHAQSEHAGLPLKDRVIVNVLANFTSKIVAVSEAVKKSIEKELWLPPKKITVIYNSAPDMSSRINRSREDIRRSLGFGQDDFVVGGLGRLERYKGYHILLDAISRIRRDDPRCRCIIVGDGPMMAPLKEQTQRLGIAKDVLFTGFRSDVAELIWAMDVVVQPSVLREGLPLAMAEAASLSRPLIATNVGGNPEIVSDGINGSLVAAGDIEALAGRVAHLMKDPSAARRMGENSRAIWLAKFTEEEMLDKIRHLYAGNTVRS